MTTRMIIIAMIVIAFAEPVKYQSNTATMSIRKTAPPIIYIDNSFSMQAGAMSGLNLATAKTKALEIVDAFPQGSDFLLVTNDFQQKHNHLVKSDGIRLFLQELEHSPRVPNIAQVVKYATMSLELQDIDPNCKKSIFIISDFQKNICDFSDAQADTLLDINLVGIPSNDICNLAIDTLAFDTPYHIYGMEEQLSATIRNYGNQPLKDVPIKLSINGFDKLNETFSINANERKTITLRYNNTQKNQVSGQVSIADHPIEYDNDMYFAYHIDSTSNILVLGNSQDNKYIRALFGRNSNFTITETTTIQDEELSHYRAIIISQMPNIPHEMSGRIQAYVAQGGNLIFVPAWNGNIQDYNYLLSMLECNSIISPDTIKCKIATVNTQSDLLKNAIRDIPENADLPHLSRYYNSMSNSYQSEEVILETDSYKKVLTANCYRAGKVYVFYTPINELSGNLSTHRLIVPIMYNAVCLSQNAGCQYYTVIGRDNGFSVKIDGSPDLSQITIKAQDTENEFIPRISGPDVFMNYKIFAENCVESPGFYHLMYEGKQKNTIAYNYDRKESELEFLTATQVADILEEKGFSAIRVMDSESKTFATDAATSASHKPLWKIFVIIALIFVGIEIFLTRFL